MKFNNVACCLVLLFTVRVCFAQQTSSYTIFDVPGATSTYPASINNGGDVAGSFCPSSNCGSFRGFVREFNGSITTFDGIPMSINDAGAVAGCFLDSVHCFLRDQKGNVTIFDVPQPNPPYPAVGWAVAINDQADIAGYLIPQPGADTYQGFVRDQHGSITTFVIDKGLVSTSINARGDITGHTAPFYMSEDGFVRERNGDITVFDVPGAMGPGPLAYPVSINNGGDVAGWFYDSPCSCDRGFVRKRDGNIMVFDATPNASSTTTASINEKGDVVGTFSDATTGSHQFLRDHKGNITIFDGPSGLAARSVSINDRDDVTGVFYDQSGKSHGFVRSAR